MIEHAIDHIRALHRQRCFAMAQRIGIRNRLGAFIRIGLGWSLSQSEAERKKIATAAAKLIKAGGGEWADLVTGTDKSSEAWDIIEASALKQMIALAKTLPVWEAFGKDVRGFGAASLAVIIGEAGELSNYSSRAKLWKRMGLAVMNGVRQGGLPSSASKDDWIAHGYNRQRRSRMWNIGDTLIKGNKDRYRELYLKRKRYEVERDPSIKPIVAHRRAQRVMEKAFLCDLWIAWRRAAIDNVADHPPEISMPRADLSSSQEELAPSSALARKSPCVEMAPFSPSAQAAPAPLDHVATSPPRGLAPANPSPQGEPAPTSTLAAAPPKHRMAQVIPSPRGEPAPKFGMAAKAPASILAPANSSAQAEPAPNIRLAAMPPGESVAPADLIRRCENCRPWGDAFFPKSPEPMKLVRPS
jgi:hypothetical protein